MILNKPPKRGFTALVHISSTTGFYKAKQTVYYSFFHQGPYRMWLLLYVNDIVLIGSNPLILLHFITVLGKKFDLNDLITIWGFRYKLML